MHKAGGGTGRVTSHWARARPRCFPHGWIRGQIPGLPAINTIITNKLHSHLNAGKSYTFLLPVRCEVSAEGHTASFCGRGSRAPGGSGPG